MSKQTGTKCSLFSLSTHRNHSGASADAACCQSLQALRFEIQLDAGLGSGGATSLDPAHEPLQSACRTKALQLKPRALTAMPQYLTSIVCEAEVRPSSTLVREAALETLDVHDAGPALTLNYDFASSTCHAMLMAQRVCIAAGCQGAASCPAAAARAWNAWQTGRVRFQERASDGLRRWWLPAQGDARFCGPCDLCSSLGRFWAMYP